MVKKKRVLPPPPPPALCFIFFPNNRFFFYQFRKTNDQRSNLKSQCTKPLYKNENEFFYLNCSSPSPQTVVFIMFGNYWCGPGQLPHSCPLLGNKFETRAKKNRNFLRGRESAWCQTSRHCVRVCACCVRVRMTKKSAPS